MYKKGKKHNFKYALGGKAYGMKSADEGRKVAGVGLPGPGPTQTMEGTVYESVANPNEPLGKFSYRPKTKTFSYEGQTYAAGQSYNIPKLGEEHQVVSHFLQQVNRRLLYNTIQV